jgi:acyl-[acyl-carrier-protein]-phospholipid O-acyltransferase/long-chain-fatty-acid--[acyl-carrier-protein] ligase
MDEDGFIEITDRASRFSKIAGEMVPHIKIEEAIQAVLQSPEQACVVTSLPDERKGEKLAVLCRRDVDVPVLLDNLKKSGLPNLWVPDPANFVMTDEIPLLGTGKIDLGSVKKQVGEALCRENKA